MLILPTYFYHTPIKQPCQQCLYITLLITFSLPLVGVDIPVDSSVIFLCSFFGILASKQDIPHVVFCSYFSLAEINIVVYIHPTYSDLKAFKLS